MGWIGKMKKRASKALDKLMSKTPAKAKTTTQEPVKQQPVQKVPVKQQIVMKAPPPPRNTNPVTPK